MVKLKSILKEITKDKEEAFPDSSLGSSTYSNKEAMKFSIDSVNKAGKIIGQAQKRVVDIFTSDMKNGRYDRIDLSRSIHKGNIWTFLWKYGAHKTLLKQKHDMLHI